MCACKYCRNQTIAFCCALYVLQFIVFRWGSVVYLLLRRGRTHVQRIKNLHIKIVNLTERKKKEILNIVVAMRSCEYVIARFTISHRQNVHARVSDDDS